MSKGTPYPKVGSIQTSSTKYVVVGDCSHVCTENGAIDSLSIKVGAKNSEYAKLKFVYGKKTLFDELSPLLPSLEIEFDWRPNPLLIPKGAKVATYLRTTDKTKRVSAIASFVLREWRSFSEV